MLLIMNSMATILTNSSKITNQKFSLKIMRNIYKKWDDNYEEFKSYFVLNGFPNISEEILNLCIMKTTRKGTIISLKGLCDHAIRRHNSKDKNSKVKQKIINVPRSLECCIFDENK